MIKKIILFCFLFGISMPKLISQTTVEELFFISFDVNPETAKSYREKIIEMAPGSMYAMYCEGWFKTKNDSLTAALTIATDLIKKYPEFLYGYLLKGNTNYFLANYNEAIKDYNKVIDMDPKEDGGYINRAQCKFYLEDYRGAIKDFDKAFDIAEHTDAYYFAEAYYYRGLAKIKLGHMDEGCLNLSKAGEMGFIKAYDEIKKQCK